MRTLPGYQLTETLYEGRRTLVHRGTRIRDGKSVIVKRLRNEYPSFNELVQFRNQYTITKNLNFPGIIKSYSLEVDHYGYALVMEDCGGISLAEYRCQLNSRNPQNSLELAEFLEIAIQLAEILNKLHQNRVIHKDIKPANLLIHPQSKQLKLIDFSISSLLPQEKQTLSSPNVLEGTLAYISPEQTGRMNRGIDYRSDFYSLGVTFYELLSGTLPFQSNDPMELVHCHIAKMPPAFSNSAQIPQVLSDMAMKLMAKNAEDRYQSALGLKFDLENCLDQLKTQRKIERFEIGRRDIGDRFIIPEKLYGREQEVSELLAAFDRVATGKNPIYPIPKSELMLVSGFSGIGKTAVINEVHKPIVRQKGYFIKGKFDQFQRNIPFSAFGQAFQDLIGQLLTETDSQIDRWKSKILSTLGENAQVIIELVPNLEYLIGKQPSVQELVGAAAQSRFNLLFQKFISIFADQKHPLVLFLDDLQWADSASLKLMQLLLSEPESCYLLIIGAYRDNEVSATHPFRLTLTAIQEAHEIVNQITLKSLEPTHLRCLVADTLICSEEMASPLAELIYQKTQGNPFFATQFLKSLYETEGLITFNLDRRYWQCDLTKIQALSLTDDVVEFMAIQLQKMPFSTQSVLKLAACIGNSFDLKSLAIISENSLSETAAYLWNALQEGLILPTSQVYKFYQNDSISQSAVSDIMFSEKINEPEPQEARYKFLHDRVQQAAYSLIPEDQKEQTHLKIGQLLLEKTSEVQREENIFAIVNHLNIGIDLIDQKNDRTQLAQLNLIAGKKAKSATANVAAVEYFRLGIELLDSNCWQIQYPLTLELYTAAAEAEYLNSNFDASRTLIDSALTYAKDLLDRVQLKTIKIQSYVVQNQLNEALVLGFSTLESLDVNLPKNPKKIHIVENLIKTKIALAGKSIESLENLPEMTNSCQLAALQILMNIAPASSLSGSLHFPIILLALLQISIKFGNSKIAAFAYGCYGLMLCDQLGDIDRGYRFGKLALTILDRFDAKELRGRVNWMFNATIRPWKEPISATVTPLLDAMHSALDSGDLEFFGYANNLYSIHLLVTAKNLEIVDRHLHDNLDLIRKLRLDKSICVPAFVRQMVLNLMTVSDSSCDLNGSVFNEQEVENITKQNSDFSSTFNYCKTLLSYLFGHYKDAIFYSNLCYQHKPNMPGIICFSLVLFYQSLALLANFNRVSKLEKKPALKQVELNQKKIRVWASHCPANYQHQYDLVEAEKARVLGKKLEAITYYDRAISGAHENGYICEEAIANEQAAKFYLTWGKDKIAQSYLIEAYYCYSRWGAKAKVLDLEQCYPQLLSCMIQTKNRPLTVQETPTLISDQTLRHSSSTPHSILDITTVFKASQALSRETKLEKVLETLMQIIIENAGADKGIVILNDPINSDILVQWTLTQGCILSDDLPSENPDFPVSLIQYVKRTQKPVLTETASLETHWANDSYFKLKQPKSLLCTPILNLGKLLGVLYLENQITAGVFTNDRLKAIDLLCSQAAISIENARLYQQSQNYAQQLEQSIEDVQKAQLQLVQSEKMSALGNLVAGVAHEINNPVSFIGGNLQPAQDYVQDLFNLIDLYQEKYPKTDAEIEDEIESIDLDYIRHDLPKLITSMKVGVDRIGQISTSLRTFSRTDKDYKVPFNIHEGIDSTLLILKHRLKADEKRPEIEILKNYGNVPEVSCFPGQLNQVFMNLIANAIDALDEGNEGKSFQDIQKNPNSIKIKTIIISKILKITIQDNGKGMPEDVKQRIFDRGFTTKGVGKGTGLGLAIAHQIIVDQHQGSLEVNSHPGQGTEFIISLPFNSSSE